MHNTSRLGLSQVDGPDPVSAFRTSLDGNMTTLDASALYASGTISARASLSGLVAGTFYFATDVSTLYCYDGTEWLLAGQKDTGWVSFPALTGFTTTNAAYRVIGDRVWLSGQLIASGSYTAGTTFCTMPAIARPSTARNPIMGFASTSVPGTVLISGAMSAGTPMTSSNFIYLDGTSYPL